MIPQIDFADLDSGNFRWKEAEYFLNSYIGNRGPHHDSFSMVCSFDAFLYTLISIEEVVSETIRVTLRKSDAYLFLKALRNANAHHFVLVVEMKDSNFPNPTSHELTINESPYTFYKIRLLFDKLRQVFADIEKRRPREKNTFDGARRFMTTLESQNTDSDLIENLMREGLNEVKSALETDA